MCPPVPPNSPASSQVPSKSPKTEPSMVETPESKMFGKCLYQSGHRWSFCLGAEGSSQCSLLGDRQPKQGWQKSKVFEKQSQHILCTSCKYPHRNIHIYTCIFIWRLQHVCDGVRIKEAVVFKYMCMHVFSTHHIRIHTIQYNTYNAIQYNTYNTIQHIQHNTLCKSTFIFTFTSTFAFTFAFHYTALHIRYHHMTILYT